MVRVTFVSADGRDAHTAEAPAGMTLLELAHRESIDIEGACGGNLACSTCHILVGAADFGRLVPPSEEEEEMLAFAAASGPSSRLGCQIVLEDRLDGLTVQLPPGTQDLRG